MTYPRDPGQDPEGHQQGNQGNPYDYPGYDRSQSAQYGQQYGQMPPAGYEGYPSHGEYGAPRPPKGLAIASLVLGILALLSSWTVVGGILLGLIGAILGIVGIVKAASGRAGGRGMAIAGLVLNILGLILGIVFITIYAQFFGVIQECMQYTDQQRVQQCVRQNMPSTQALDTSSTVVVRK